MCHFTNAQRFYVWCGSPLLQCTTGCSLTASCLQAELSLLQPCPCSHLVLKTGLKDSMENAGKRTHAGSKNCHETQKNWRIWPFQVVAGRALFFAGCFSFDYQEALQVAQIGCGFSMLEISKAHLDVVMGIINWGASDEHGGASRLSQAGIVEANLNGNWALNSFKSLWKCCCLFQKIIEYRLHLDRHVGMFNASCRASVLQEQRSLHENDCAIPWPPALHAELIGWEDSVPTGLRFPCLHPKCLPPSKSKGTAPHASPCLGHWFLQTKPFPWMLWDKCKCWLLHYWFHQSLYFSSEEATQTKHWVPPTLDPKLPASVWPSPEKIAFLQDNIATLSGFYCHSKGLFPHPSTNLTAEKTETNSDPKRSHGMPQIPHCRKNNNSNNKYYKGKTSQS